MLPYYSSFKVAEQFLMLEALFQNRVDLGVGRAPGGDMRTAQAVAAGSYNRGNIFPQQVAELIALFDGKLLDDSLARGVLLQPQDRHASRVVDGSAPAISAVCSPRSSTSASRLRISSTLSMDIA